MISFRFVNFQKLVKFINAEKALKLLLKAVKTECIIAINHAQFLLLGINFDLYTHTHTHIHITDFSPLPLKYN